MPIERPLLQITKKGGYTMETLKTFTDEQLVEMYANGDNRAFDILLERYQSKLYSYILYVVKNEEMTEDIFQETFMKAIVTIKQGRYTDTGRFASWLTRIAHNLIIDNFRQEKYENTVSNDDTEKDLFNDSRLTDSNVEEQIVQKQIHTDVRKLVELLPDNQKEVIQMRFYLGLSFKEISEKTGVSINTALGRMRYAILNMRRIAKEKNLILTFD